MVLPLLFWSFENKLSSISSFPGITTGNIVAFLTTIAAELLVMGNDRDNGRNDGPDDDGPPNIAENLKALRRGQGMSLETLAKLSGVSRAMLGQIETQKSVPTITVVWKIARALGVEATDLLTRRAMVSQTIVYAAKTRVIAGQDEKFALKSFASADFPLPFEFSQIEIAPGHREQIETFSPGLRATLLVTAGEIELERAGEATSRIRCGDAILFHADTAHSYFNPGAVPAKAVLVTANRRNGVN